MHLLERIVPAPVMTDAREYGALGQTRALDIEVGAAHAFVQGRADSAYRTSIHVKKLPEDLWARLAQAMADQAVYAARLLGGELPSNIEELFAPLGARLFPAEPNELEPSCSCKETTKPWCKHAACVGLLLAQKLAGDPLLILTLRGMPSSELTERVRQRRAVTGATGAVPVHSIRVPGVSDQAVEPLERALDHFWDTGPELAQLDLPLAPPPVSHPLLRRLGPSPFTESRFPLVGLLATCYELISKKALESAADDVSGTGQTDPEA